MAELFGQEIPTDEIDIPPARTNNGVLRRFVKSPHFEDDGSNKIVEVEIIIDSIPSKDAEYIFSELLHPWIEGFIKKNKDYTNHDLFHAADLLGEKGQFAEIWRKVGKLYNALWIGQEMLNEKPDEILDDLIGHAFLAKLYLAKQRNKHSNG